MEKKLVRVKSVKPLQGFCVKLYFTDGSTKEIDLTRYLSGPIFECIRNDPAEFKKIAVDQELGTIVWPNGADVCPDVLYHGRTPASLEKSQK